MCDIIDEFSRDKTLRVALEQSAVDSCCFPEDFLKKDNVVVRSEERQGRRAYLSAPYDFDLTSYGGNVVACVREGLEGVAHTYLGKYPPAHCFETPALHELDKMLAPFRLKTCFQAEYFLPAAAPRSSGIEGFEVRLLEPEGFAGLYLPQ